METIDIVFETTDNSNEFTSLYTQFADQITSMMSTVLMTSDQQEQMTFRLENININLTVAKIHGDGNCLFGSLVHQIFGYPIKSTQHRSQTNELRKEVVEYILAPQNFTSFEYQLQNCVYETKPKTEITDMTTECKNYVRNVLARDTEWAGYETIMTVSAKYRVNILTFQENGLCVIHYNKHEKYGKTIAIAYRIGFDKDGNKVMNHYDSVCDMHANDIKEVIEWITNKNKKK